MPYEIFHEPENNIVVRKYTGDVSIEDLYGATRESWAMKQEHASGRFLSEFINTRLVFTLDQLIEFSSQLESIGIDKMDRAAIVLDPEGVVDLDVHLRVFGVGAEKGNVQVFHDYSQALDWLCS